MTCFYMFISKCNNIILLPGLSECAPDLSDPMSAATYAAEEISTAKDGFVRYYSDEEGTTAHVKSRKPFGRR